MKYTCESQRQHKRVNIESKSTEKITPFTYIQAQRTTTIYLHTGIARHNYLMISYLLSLTETKMAAENKMAVIQPIIHYPKNSEWT